MGDSLEVFPLEKKERDRLKEVKSEKKKEEIKKPSKVATVKPFSSSTSKSSTKPIVSKSPTKTLTFKAVLSSYAKSSAHPRTPSSVKCQCARHTVIGYPPSSCSYWTVGTTPGVNSTILDFDNEGTKYLYEQGDLKSFQAVISSFKP